MRYHQHHYVTRLACDPLSRRVTGACTRRELNSEEERIEADYYVVAVPVERLAQFINDDRLAVDGTLCFVQKLAAPATQALWMNGIQYYLNVDVPLAPGHVICLDSPWALTGISQAQFWPRHPLAGYGDGQVKGLISIDVSNWFEQGLNGKKATDYQLPEVAKEVWEELKKSLMQVDGTSLLTDALLVRYHIDSDIAAGTQHPVPPPLHSPFAAEPNTEPLLVSTANSWSLRPEELLRHPQPVSALRLRAHQHRPGHDGGCQRGGPPRRQRHQCGQRSAVPLCQIWPLHEPDILAVLRWRDRQRFAKGLPWSDVLEDWPTRLLHEANYLWHCLRGVK